MAWSDEMESLASEVTDSFGVAATYVTVQTTLATFDTATGKRAPTETTTTVSIVRGRVESESFDPGRRPVDRVRWTIAADQLAATPKVGDRISEGGRTWQITAVEAVCDRAAFELITHRVSA